MKKLLHISKYSFFLLLIISCVEEVIIPVDTPLSVRLIASSYEIKSGDSFMVSVEVENADSLFALSFELNFDPNSLSTPTENFVSIGNLFLDPFPGDIPIFPSDGQVSVGFGESGSIRNTVSGVACNIMFTALNTGTVNLYISSIEMIKKDGFEIDGLDDIIIDSVEIQVN